MRARSRSLTVSEYRSTYSKQSPTAAGPDVRHLADQSRRSEPKSASPFMEDLLTAEEAAKRLGISTSTLYDWLGQSDVGILLIRGQSVTIDYLQGGPNGQGRIRIEAKEVQRLLDLMRVQPCRLPPRRLPMRRHAYPGITVKLGRPEA
jgi:hypothetical protein